MLESSSCEMLKQVQHDDIRNLSVSARLHRVLTLINLIYRETPPESLSILQ